MQPRTLMLATLAVLAAGCGGPTLDASTDEALEETTTEVREALPADRRARFDTALMRLAVGSLDMESLLAGDAEDVTGPMRDRLDGLTGPEVIAMADSIRLADATEEIADLESRKAAAEAAADSLDAFVVEEAEFAMEEQYFGGDQPIFELTVTNGLDVAVSRAYFRGTLKSPDRSVPWIDDTFNYEIGGGIEPGETLHWRLQPNMFSDWADVDAPADAQFVVRPIRVDGPDGEPLFGGVSWDDEDQARLEELRSVVESLAG